MKGVLKVFFLMLAVPLVFTGLSRFFALPLALWGAVMTAGLLGVAWFHRARSKGRFVPYIILWALLLCGMYYVSGSPYCGPGGMAADLSSLLCPFPR